MGLPAGLSEALGDHDHEAAGPEHVQPAHPDVRTPVQQTRVGVPVVVIPPPPGFQGGQIVVIVGAGEEVVADEVVVSVDQLDVLVVVEEAGGDVEGHEGDHGDELEAEEEGPGVAHPDAEEDEGEQV